MASQYVKLPLSGGGPGAGVSSVNALTGALILTAGSGISITQTGAQELTVANTAGVPTGNNNTFAGFDGTGTLFSIPGFNIDTNSGGVNENLTIEPDNNGSLTLNTFFLSLDPLQNSPNDVFTVENKNISIDPSSTGFTIGTAGVAAKITNNDITHSGTSDVGSLQLIVNNLNIGNGTDPIDVGNLGYVFGFGQVNANVTLTGGMQGYGFQPAVNASATMLSNTNSVAFYDAANIACASPSYTSFAASPNIAEIVNNNNYQGISMSGNMPLFSGNAGYTGVNVAPNIGTVGTQNVGGQFQGVSISPTIANNINSAVGINVFMGNVTNAAGAQASLVVQDITYTFIQFGSPGNDIAIEYLNTTTAGNEVATVTPGVTTVVSVTIESGVSTATQVKAALDANITVVSNLTTTITGTASNPQVTYAQTNLAGGINPGTKKAAQFNGDVEIQGSLSFTGGLSLGALNSFASVDISGFPSGVNSIDTLITQPSVPANTTLNTDLLAINTAMLMNIGANSTLTSSFLGYAALGLPAVVNMGTGATIDRVGGATFAISLDSGAGGGTIANVDLCRALSIPNGVTTITRLKGYAMDLPFGDPGTTTWGFYESPGVNNYMAGNLLVGGTAGSDDTVTNSSVALEIKSTTKAFVLSRMTTAERNALTAINGMMIYNTTTDKFQGYEAGAWVDLV